MTANLDFAAAASRIRRFAWRTPLLPLDEIGSFGSQGTTQEELAIHKLTHAPVTIKLESLQRTGSFKARGATNRLAKLTAGERQKGVVAASSGNHGRAVAEASRWMGVRATICVPDWVDRAKLAAIQRTGARVQLSGATYDAAEEEAARIACNEGLTLVHPFDDLDVIEGQGTVGLELLEQFSQLEEVVVPLSGGGLVAGIGLAVREKGIKVVAVSAERASVMRHSLRTGRPVTVPEEDTLASALSGGIGLDNSFTFQLVGQVVSEHVSVSEAQIREAVARAFREHHLVVEGGGAVGLAALWSGSYRPGGPTAVVISGGNIAPQTLVSVLEEDARGLVL